MKTDSEELTNSGGRDGEGMCDDSKPYKQIGQGVTGDHLLRSSVHQYFGSDMIDEEHSNELDGNYHSNDNQFQGSVDSISQRERQQNIRSKGHGNGQRHFVSDLVSYQEEEGSGVHVGSVSVGQRQMGHPSVPALKLGSSDIACLDKFQEEDCRIIEGNPITNLHFVPAFERLYRQQTVSLGISAKLK